MYIWYISHVLNIYRIYTRVLKLKNLKYFNGVRLHDEEVIENKLRQIVTRYF